MKKLLLALLCVCVVPAFAFDLPPATLIVHNNISDPSQVLRGSFITQPAKPGLNLFPWQAVFVACGDNAPARAHCKGTVLVDQTNGTILTAGIINVNANNGKIEVERVFNGYEITVNGKGDVTLSKPSA